MKKKIVTLINLFILCTLCIINVIFLCNMKINNDGILMLAFAIIFLILYILGVLFPNTIVKIIHQISLKLYKNSENINVPSLIEAKRTFLKRLIYILVCCNICLLLSLITYLI
jgi:hypothetical protein